MEPVANWSEYKLNPWWSALNWNGETAAYETVERVKPFSHYSECSIFAKQKANSVCIHEK